MDDGAGTWRAKTLLAVGASMLLLGSTGACTSTAPPTATSTSPTQLTTALSETEKYLWKLYRLDDTMTQGESADYLVELATRLVPEDTAAIEQLATIGRVLQTAPQVMEAEYRKVKEIFTKEATESWQSAGERYHDAGTKLLEALQSPSTPEYRADRLLNSRAHLVFARIQLTLVTKQLKSK
ncbi:MAG: hypothetical protein EXR60_02875 [Dehalococcoidia bacterium]|nr:hypothetical protein [Dehalococcoidia bacterium]